MAKFPAPSTDEPMGEEPKDKSIAIMAIKPQLDSAILDLGPEQAKTAGLSDAKKGDTFTLQIEVEVADDAKEGVSLKVKDVQNIGAPEEDLSDEEMGDDEEEEKEDFTGKMKPRPLSPKEAGLDDGENY